MTPNMWEESPSPYKQNIFNLYWFQKQPKIFVNKRVAIETVKLFARRQI